MVYNIVASGSKGNATIVKSHNTVILIDFGISLAKLKDGLKEINLSFSDIDAAIFTHEHGDHIRGIKELSPKKMYALNGTLSSLCNVIKIYEPFAIKNITITAFKISHDAINPCGYILKDEKESLVYMTDTGMFIEENKKYINNPTYLIIESNHDIKMLMKSSRPMELKRRILSERGHLCNEDSAFIASSIVGSNTKEIVLAHVSEECNSPEAILSAYEKIFSYRNIDIHKYNIKIASQHSSLIGGTINED